MSEQNKSEVARLMQQIDLECEAIRRVFDEPAIVASHDSINARYNNLGKVKEELEQHVGKQEANNAVTDAYGRIVG